MAVSSRLKTAIAERVDGLGLVLGDVPVTVQVRKAPKTERGLETPPQGQITAAPQSGKNEWWDTGTSDTPRGRKRCEYWFEVTLTVAGNRDPVTNEDAYDDWREAIARAFEPPSVLDVEELWDLRIHPGQQYDREGFPRNYDQSRILLQCITVETAA